LSAAPTGPIQHLQGDAGAVAVLCVCEWDDRYGWRECGKRRSSFSADHQQHGGDQQAAHHRTWVRRM